MNVRISAVIASVFLAGVAAGWALRTSTAQAAGEAPASVGDGPFKNYAPAAIAALQKSGIAGDCPLCKQNQWVVHEVPVSLPVYNVSGKVAFPGESMPAAAMICKKCGYMSLHSLGALGLLDQLKKDASK